jgi:hypothetical protein
MAERRERLLESLHCAPVGHAGVDLISLKPATHRLFAGSQLPRTARVAARIRTSPGVSTALP